MSFNLDYHLKRRPEWMTKLFKEIDQYCLSIRKGVTRTCLMTYIRYNSNRGKMFCRIFITRKNMKIYLNLDYPKLENPPAFCRDYSGMARTKDTVELTFDNEEEYLQNGGRLFAITSRLIEESFNRVSGRKTVAKLIKPIKEKSPVMSKVLTMRLTVEGDYVNISIRVPKDQLNKVLDKLLY